jgi:hypothetical protein
MEARPHPGSDGAIYGILGSIDRLHRLAATIRQPASSDDMEKVQNFARKQGPDAFDDIVFLIINFKFPRAAETLQIQLAKSVIYRRNRLRYQQSHQIKLATSRKDENPAANPLTLGSSPKTDPTSPHKLHQGDMDTHPKSVTVRSKTQPTVFDKAKFRENQDRPAMVAPTVMSSGSSDRVGEIMYPSPPTVPTNSSYTNCQFCSKELLASDINDPRWWRYDLCLRDDEY